MFTIFKELLYSKWLHIKQFQYGSTDNLDGRECKRNTIVNTRTFSLLFIFNSYSIFIIYSFLEFHHQFLIDWKYCFDNIVGWLFSSMMQIQEIFVSILMQNFWNMQIPPPKQSEWMNEWMSERNWVYQMNELTENSVILSDTVHTFTIILEI